MNARVRDLRRAALLAALLLAPRPALAFGCGGQEPAIAAAFTGLRTAFADGRADDVADGFGAESLRQCETLRRLASSGSASLAQLTTGERAFVTFIRARLPAPELRESDCSALIRHASRALSAERADVSSLRLGPTLCSSVDRGAAPVLARDGSPVGTVVFARDDARRWRLDLRNTLYLTGRVLEALAAVEGVGVDELVSRTSEGSPPAGVAR